MIILYAACGIPFVGSLGTLSLRSSNQLFSSMSSAIVLFILLWMAALVGGGPLLVIKEGQASSLIVKYSDQEMEPLSMFNFSKNKYSNISEGLIHLQLHAIQCQI